MPSRHGSKKTNTKSSRKYKANPKIKKTPKEKNKADNKNTETTPTPQEKPIQQQIENKENEETTTPIKPMLLDEEVVTVEETKNDEEKLLKNENKPKNKPTLSVEESLQEDEVVLKQKQQLEKKDQEKKDTPIEDEKMTEENKLTTPQDEEHQIQLQDEVVESLEILGTTEEQESGEEDTPTTPVQYISQQVKYQPPVTSLEIEVKKPWQGIESSDDTRSKGSPLVHSDLYIPISDTDQSMPIEMPSPMSLHQADDLPGQINEKTPITKFSTNSSEELSHQQDRDYYARKTSSLAHLVHGMDRQQKLQRKSTLANMNAYGTTSKKRWTCQCNCRRSISLSMGASILTALILIFFTINQISLYFSHYGGVNYRKQFIPNDQHPLYISKRVTESNLAPLSMNAHSIQTLLSVTADSSFNAAIMAIQKLEANLAKALSQKDASRKYNDDIYPVDPMIPFNLNDQAARPWGVKSNYTILYFHDENTAYAWYRTGETLENETITIPTSPFASLNRSSNAWYMTNSTTKNKIYGYMLPLEDGRAIYIGTPLSLLTEQSYYRDDISLLVDRQSGIVLCSSDTAMIGRPFNDAVTFGSTALSDWLRSFSAAGTTPMDDGIYHIQGITPGFITLISRLESPSIDMIMLVKPRTNYSYHILIGVLVTVSVCIAIVSMTVLMMLLYRHLFVPIQQLTEMVSVIQVENYSKSSFDACYDQISRATFMDIDELRYHLANLLYKLEIFIPYVPQDVIDEQESSDTSSLSSISEADSIIQSDLEDPTGDSGDDEKWIVEHTDEDTENLQVLTTSTPTPGTSRTDDKLHPEIFNTKGKRRQMLTPRSSHRRPSGNAHSSGMINKMHHHKNQKLRYGHSTVMVVWLHNVERMLNDGLQLFDFSNRYESFFSKVRHAARSHRGTLDNFSESIMVFTFRRVFHAIDAAIAMDNELQRLPLVDARQYSFEYSIGVSSGREWHGLIGDESMKKRHSFGRVSRRAKHLAVSLYDTWGARVVICENSARQIEKDYKVAPITYVEKLEMGRTLAFQLAGKYDLWDGEWMYQLRIQQEKRDFKIFNDAFQQYMYGNMDKALELFNSFAKTDSTMNVQNLVKQFKERCMRDNANPQPKIVTIAASPTSFRHHHVNQVRHRVHRSNSVSMASLSSESKSSTPTSPFLKKKSGEI